MVPGLQRASPPCLDEDGSERMTCISQGWPGGLGPRTFTGNMWVTHTPMSITCASARNTHYERQIK
jgi:hypothetical protein